MKEILLEFTKELDTNCEIKVISLEELKEISADKDNKYVANLEEILQWGGWKHDNA